MLEYLRIAATVTLLLMSVVLAPLLVAFGLLGMAGRLSDTSPWADTFAGVQLLGMAAVIWSVLFAWYASLHLQRWRFSLRALLIATALVAVVLGSIVAVR